MRARRAHPPRAPAGQEIEPFSCGGDPRGHAIELARAAARRAGSYACSELEHAHLDEGDRAVGRRGAATFHPAGALKA